MKQLNRFYFDQAISIDNALTTNQIIHQLIHNLNGVIEFVNNIETDAHEYTDAEISKLKIELEGEIGELNDLLDLRVSELTNLIDTKKAEAVSDAKGYTDVSIENLKTDYITPIIDRIDNTLNRLDLKIDFVDASIRNLVDETKAELIELIKKGNSIIYSGYSGLRTPIQDEIYNIYNILTKLNGLTWDIFDTWFNFYNICYSKSYPTANSGNTFIFNDYIITCITVNTISDFSIVDNGDETCTVTMTAPITYLNVDGVTFHQCHSTAMTYKTYSVTTTQASDTTCAMVFTMSTDVWYNNNFSYFFLREGNTARLRFSIDVNPFINTAFPQKLTWATIETINDICSNRLTYNLVSYNFWSNLNNALLPDLLDARERISQTFTNNKVFGDNFSSRFAGINSINLNTPCETILSGIKYDYSNFMKGV